MDTDYTGMYASCVMTTDIAKLVQLNTICDTALANRNLYLVVSKTVKVPWPIIAAIHFRESNQNFTRHLHNGDPLTARTVHAPVGRPVQGDAPFTWPESAIDVFTGFWRPPSWDIGGCLQFMERYNGMGYRRRGINTPYLWDFTDKYVSGLFTEDGEFNPQAKESRPGAVSILKTLALKGVSLEFNSIPTSGFLLH